MVVDGGHLIVDWGRTDTKFKSASMRKSFISALYGIAVEQNKIDLQATIGQLGITDKQPLSEREKSAKVIDLLQSRSGVYDPAVVATTPPPERDTYKPGEHWYYNDWDFNVLGTIYEQKTGTRIGPAFYEQVAQKIGVQDFTPTDVSYVFGEDSVHPQYPFLVSARDLARFALLYLSGGRWGDEQVVPAKWVERTHTVSETVALSGIGYELLWSQQPEQEFAKGLYFAMGGGGHRIFVAPEDGVVMIVRPDTFAPASDATRVTTAESHGLLRMVMEMRSTSTG